MANRKYVVLNRDDNVGVALQALAAGERAGEIALREKIPVGHKFSLRPIAAGEAVVKYGTPVATAIADIPAGSCVHTHNVCTNLSGEESYAYVPDPSRIQPGTVTERLPVFMGYRRRDSFGIRNEVWVVPTVGCVSWLAERFARAANAIKPAAVERVLSFSHPYGCMPPGDDLENSRTILANMGRHPNAGGVLFVGLGCENNVMNGFRKKVESLPDCNPNLGFMVAQDVEDEMAEGMRLLEGILERAGTAVREPAPVSELCIGLKCGASDGLSGITANPLAGAFSDWLVARGGRVVLTEVPEMFGAERALLNRAGDAKVFCRGVEMINDFKKYFARHGRAIYENPSPGNIMSGLSTLEDKSVGCVQKIGYGEVTDILPYGGVVTRPGVALLSGPGEDMVAVTNLSAAGAHLVLFTTGRGNPLGGVVPVVKIASSGELARRKPHWIDFDAGPLAGGEGMESVLERFVGLILSVASGRETRNEEFGYREFTIFKDGVTT